MMMPSGSDTKFHPELTATLHAKRHMLCRLRKCHSARSKIDPRICDLTALVVADTSLQDNFEAIFKGAVFEKSEGIGFRRC